MTDKEKNLLWDVVFDAKVWAEDAIELAKNGFPHGYKKGVVERKLKQADQALEILDRESRQ